MSRTIKMTRTCASPTVNRQNGKTYHDVPDEEAESLCAAGAAVIVPPGPPAAEEDIDGDATAPKPIPAHADRVAEKAQTRAMHEIGSTTSIAETAHTAAHNAVRVGRSEDDAIAAGLAAAEALAAETMTDDGWFIDKGYTHERWVKPRGEVKAELEAGTDAVVGYLGYADANRVGDRFDSADAAKAAVDSKLAEITATEKTDKETATGQGEKGKGKETTQGKGAGGGKKTDPPKTDPKSK